MNIYKAEKSIGELIKNNKTVLCYSQADSKLSDVVRAGFNRKLDIASASIDDSDLYYHQSILVTTTWNKNDEIFLPEQVWAARHSPTHKPTNFHHNSSRIVGHIVDNYAVDENINLISEDTTVDSLPDKFHILTGSVIYKVWHSDEEYEHQVAQLIEQVEYGNIYVSMECKFKDFAYAIKDDDDNITVVNRNAETAFLSLHLRAYGGNGHYKNLRIGRVLKDITFIGKGYVDNPANEESIVFSPSTLFSFSNLSFAEKLHDFEKDGVLLSSNQNKNGDLLMSDVNAEKATELSNQNAELKAEVARLKAEVAKASVENHEAKINTLVEEKQSLATNLEAAHKDLTEVKAELDKSKAGLDELTKVVADSNAAKAELEKEIAELKAEKVLSARKSQLVEAGFSAEDAESQANAFASLNDEQFGVIFTTLSKQLAELKKSTANTETDLDELEVNEEGSTASEDGEDETEEELYSESSYDGLDQMSDTAKSFASLLGNFYKSNPEDSE